MKGRITPISNPSMTEGLLRLITFTPDTAGTYMLSISATDSCDASDYDEIAVTVVLNEAPVCVVPENQLFITVVLNVILLICRYLSDINLNLKKLLKFNIENQISIKYISVNIALRKFENLIINLYNIKAILI